MFKMAYTEEQSWCCSGLINTLYLPTWSFTPIFHVYFIFPYDEVILYPPKFPQLLTEDTQCG